MSNYPPGVTGSEPQIAGYPETTLAVTCEHVVADVLDWWCGTVDCRTCAKGWEARRVPTPHEGLAVCGACDQVLCGWSGKVDGTVGGYDFCGECPACGGAIVVDVEVEP